MGCFRRLGLDGQEHDHIITCGRWTSEPSYQGSSLATVNECHRGPVRDGGWHNPGRSACSAAPPRGGRGLYLVVVLLVWLVGYLVCQLVYVFICTNISYRWKASSTKLKRKWESRRFCRRWGPPGQVLNFSMNVTTRLVLLWLHQMKNSLKL